MLFTNKGNQFESPAKKQGFSHLTMTLIIVQPALPRLKQLELCVVQLPRDQPVVVEIVPGRKLRSIKFPSQYSDCLLLLIHIHGTNYAAKEPAHDGHVHL